MSRPTCLYRLFDADDALLYVGISVSSLGRLGDHLREKSWAPSVVRTSIEWFDTREEAAAAEVRAIAEEHPLHNIQHRPKPEVKVVTRTVTKTVREQVFAWSCSFCDDPISDGKGGITVLASRMRQAYAEQAEAERFRAERVAELGRVRASFFSIEELDRAYPDRAPWLALHWSCVPEGDECSYEIDVERARTPSQLLDWTAHLLEKGWVTEATAWEHLVRRALGSAGLLGSA